MIGKQVLAFGKSEISKFINIGIFAASSGGRKGRRHIGSFTPDRERSHVCWLTTGTWLVEPSNNVVTSTGSPIKIAQLTIVGG